MLTWIIILQGTWRKILTKRFLELSYQVLATQIIQSDKFSQYKFIQEKYSWWIWSSTQTSIKSDFCTYDSSSFYPTLKLIHKAKCMQVRVL